MKRCPRCCTEYPIAEFGTLKSGRPRSWCRSCDRAYKREWRKRNPDKRSPGAQEARLARARRQHRRLQAPIIAAKDRPCADCGDRHPYFVMDFDHVRGDKLFNISEWLRAPRRTMAEVEAEIEKCDVVCANCHRYRTARRRTNKTPNPQEG